MAGILVSGGTYSGSGDVTTDWFKTDGSDWRVTLPDGTMTITSESGSWAMLNQWPGSSEYWKHGSGTVKFTTPAGTLVNVMGVNPSDGHFYNVIVNQDAYGASKDPVNFASSDEGSHLVIKNNCTITSGTFSTASNPSDDSELYEIGGGLILATSGAFIQGYSGDAGFPPGFQYNAYGNLKVGYIEGQDWYGGSGVQLVLSSGTTTINGSGPSERGLVFHDQRAGHLHHSSGTVRFEPGTGVTQKLRWNNDGGAIYNAVVSGGASSDVRGFMSGDDYLNFTNDLTIDAGKIGTYGDKLRVSGNVFVNSGTLDTHTSNGTTTPHSMGSLDIKADGTYNATAYTTNITSNNGGARAFKMATSPAGTFTHNDGTVVISDPVSGLGNIGGNDSDTITFYNLIIEGDNKETRDVPLLDVVNDLTIDSGLNFGPEGVDGAINVSGTTLVSGTLDLNTGAGADHIFGALIIEGVYNATAGETYVGSGTVQNILDIDGTFTHNDGTIKLGGPVLVSGSYPDPKITGSATITSPFYNLITGFSYIYRGITVENNHTTSGDGGGPTNYYTTGPFIYGTATSSATIDCSLTGVKCTHSAPTISGASAVYPIQIVSSNKFDFHSSKTTLFNADFLSANTIDDDAEIDADNVDFKQGITTNDAIGDCKITVASGAYFAASGMNLGDSTTFSVTGALVKMYGSYLEDNAATIIGEDTATLWVDLTDDAQYISPNGSQLNPYYKNVFWGGEGRINQDTMFRSSNFVIGGDFYSQNRPIGTSGAPPNITIANGGTIESATNTFNASTFNNRGGLFASSSAFDFDGGTGHINCGDGASLDNIFDGGGTVEAWIKADGDAETGSGMRPINKDQWFIGIDNATGDFYKLRLYYFWSGANPSWTTTNIELTRHKWHHFAVTYDADAVANNPTIYIDGKMVPVTQNAAPDPATTRDSDVGYDLRIGDRADGIRTFNGPIAMVRMWSDTRTAAEIRANMFNQYSDMASTTGLVGMWQFDEGEGGTVADVSTSGNTGTITFGSSAWATGGTWTAGNILSSTGELYIGNRGAEATIFASSKFVIGNRKLIEGAKFASKAHEGTYNYYIDTSGATDYLAYQQLAGAPIGSSNDVDIMPNSYFTFDTAADNEQCNTLLNETGSTVRINTDEDFYTQDFDNKGTWLRNTTYGGTIHDDGSTPHEYNPIDIMDDQDSGFDTEDLID